MQLSRRPSPHRIYPQPEWLIDRARLAKIVPRTRVKELWRIPEPLLADAQDDATLIAIRDMERAGIDVITDGEMRRESYSNRFATALEGIDNDNPAVITNTATVTVGLESPTAVLEQSSASMAVSPNPGSDRVRFDFSPNPSEKGLLSMYSATGQLVLNDKPVVSGQPVDVSGLPTGIYTAVIRYADQVRSVKWIRE